MSRCFVCGSGDLFYYRYDNHKGVAVLRQSINDLITRKIFKGWIQVCSVCGYGEMMNPPSQQQLDYYYANVYESNGNPGKHYRRNQNQGEFIGIKDIRVGSLLELGSGKYPFGNHWADRIENAECVDPGGHFGSVYKSVNDIPCGKKYDLIHCSHTLEHVLDLDEFFYVISFLIPDGGRLFIEVPNCHLLYYWEQDKRDEPHVHFFTEESLKKLLENKGFNCVRFGCEQPGEKGPILRGVFEKIGGSD